MRLAAADDRDMAQLTPHELERMHGRTFGQNHMLGRCVEWQQLGQPMIFRAYNQCAVATQILLYR